MARGKPLSANIREKILSDHKEGKSYRIISAKTGVNRSTIHTIIKKYEQRKRLRTTTGPRFGGPRKTNHTDDLFLQRVVEMNPYDSFVEVKKKWEREIKKPVSMTTCRRRLNELGIRLAPRVNPPFQSIREPEVNIYAEEEKMTPRPSSSLLEEQSFTLDSVQENGEDTFHKPEVRHKKSKKTSSKRKLKKSSTIQATLDSLKTVTKAITTQHDEFSLFGEYMAMSLRTMPMRNALKCKEKLLSVVVNERLSLNSESS